MCSGHQCPQISTLQHTDIKRVTDPAAFIYQKCCPESMANDKPCCSDGTQTHHTDTLYTDTPYTYIHKGNENLEKMYQPI